jgi:predicted DNA-binding protein
MRKKKGKITNYRLTPETLREIARIAKARGTTKTSVIEESVRRTAEEIYGK